MSFDEEKLAYEIILQRHLNDDRLMHERSSIYVASNSILFLGFLTLPSSYPILRIFLPVLGFIFSFFFMFTNQRTKRGLDFWDKKADIIEQKADGFKYMRENCLLPSQVYVGLGGIPNRIMNTYILPILFALLWVLSFVQIFVSK